MKEMERRADLQGRIYTGRDSVRKVKAQNGLRLTKVANDNNPGASSDLLAKNNKE